MYVVLWEFEAAVIDEFELAYGPTGAWAELFRPGEGYLGTELLRDLEKPGRYVTIDRWTSVAAYERFRETHRTAYDELDKRCERFTRSEVLIGRFEGGGNGLPDHM